MNKNFSGLFSLGLQSIEWQIKNLFQDCGGEKTIQLMDKLAAIPEKQREILLEKFLAQADECIKNTPQKNNLVANNDIFNLAIDQLKLKKIEDQIVNDVVSEMNKHSRLSIVNGGKSSASSTASAKLFDFESAKKQKAKKLCDSRSEARVN